jgi:type III secretion system YscQ/HrcQ family protein
MATKKTAALSAAGILQIHNEHLVSAKHGLYGKESELIDTPCGMLLIRFEEVALTYVQLSITVRCAGFECEVMLADPQAFVDLNATLNANVPYDLQMAALLYVTRPLLNALESVFKSSITVLSFQSDSPILTPQDTLGFSATFTAPINDSERICKGLLRMHDVYDWDLLVPALQPRLLIPDCSVDLLVDFSVEFTPVLISLKQFDALETGDVLVLDALAQDRRQETLLLRYGEHFVRGITVQRSHHGVEVIAIAPAFNQFNDSIKMNQHTTSDNNVSLKNINVHEKAELDAVATHELSFNDLNQLNIAIECSLNTISISFAELQNLSEGQVFSTNKKIDDETITLKYHGQVIGSGQLVAIGDRLGVRISAITVRAQDVSKQLSQKVLMDNKKKKIDI